MTDSILSLIAFIPTIVATSSAPPLPLTRLLGALLCEPVRVGYSEGRLVGFRYTPTIAIIDMKNLGGRLSFLSQPKKPLMIAQ